MVFSFIPEALANTGLEPTATIDKPDLVLKKKYKRRQDRKNKTKVPVGILRPKKENDRKLSIIWLVSPGRTRVVLKPLPPIAQTSVGFLKGAKSQKVHIKETVANPI